MNIFKTIKVHDSYNISAKQQVDGTPSQTHVWKSARPSAIVTSLGVCKNVCPFTSDPKETRCPAVEVVTWPLEVVYSIMTNCIAGKDGATDVTLRSLIRIK